MEETYKFLNDELKIKYGDSLVVAVSGGPDSMALLNLLLKLKRALDLELICVHVNHTIFLYPKLPSLY